MKKILSLSIIFMLCIAGCQLDDDDAVIYNEPAEGSWSLINVSGTLAGLDQDIEAGVVVWTFNETDGTVTVVNNNTDNEIETFFETGIYSYVLQDNENNDDTCEQSMVIEGINFGCQTFTEDTMILSTVHADGHQLTFKN